MERHNLLFTGGFDSTFRLCQLSRMEGVEVQPVYFKFDDLLGRSNQQKEIDAQDAVISCLRNKSATKAVIFNPIRLSDSDLPYDPDYDEAFDFWHNSHFIQSQLRCIGKVPLLFPGIEIAREGPTLKHREEGYIYGKTRTALMHHGMKFVDNPDGSVLIDGSHAEPGLDLLYCRFTYPILGIPETSMAPLIHEWGYEDVFKLTWTCDFNLDHPCGVCHNCETKWDSGLKGFFGPEATRNHMVKLYLEKHNQELSEKFNFVSSSSFPELFTRYVQHNYFLSLNFSLNPDLSIEARNFLFGLFHQKSLDIMFYFKSLMNQWEKDHEVDIHAS